jgi:2-hydroxy-3-keto-5-methylthiopentenyl-1-phosphate phosphatase
MSSRVLLPSRATWQVLVDFDGTIAPDDPTDYLLERFALPAWLVTEQLWQSGQISSRECMKRQAELLRVTPEDLDEVIRGVRIDPGFAPFLSYCRRLGADVKIVSDGFDRVIGAALRNARISVPFFANKLEWQGGDRWRLAFPYSRNECSVGSANCKCSHAEPLPGPRVVVGDGRSDFCMSTRADFVIAKGSLAEYCRARGQEHAVFTDFDHVKAHLQTWLAASGRVPAKAPRVYSRPPQLPVLET